MPEWSRITDEHGRGETASYNGHEIEVFQYENDLYWQYGLDDESEFQGEFMTIDEAKQAAICEVNIIEG